MILQINGINDNDLIDRDEMCITRRITAMVVDITDTALIEAVKTWAKKNNVNEVLLFDEERLKEIIKLGVSEYKKIHGDI